MALSSYRMVANRQSDCYKMAGGCQSNSIVASVDKASQTHEGGIQQSPVSMHETDSVLLRVCNAV